MKKLLVGLACLLAGSTCVPLQAATTRPVDVTARLHALARACDLDKDTHTDIEAIGSEMRDKTLEPKEAEERLKLLVDVAERLQTETRLISSDGMQPVKFAVEHMLGRETSWANEVKSTAHRGQWGRPGDKVEAEYVQARAAAEKTLQEALSRAAAPAQGEVTERLSVEATGDATISSVEVRQSGGMLGLDPSGKVMGRGPQDLLIHDLEGVGDIGGQSQIFIVTGTPASPTRFRILRWTGDGFTMDHEGALVQREPTMFGWAAGEVSGGEWISHFRTSLDDGTWVVSFGPQYGSAVISGMPGGFNVEKWIVKPKD